MLLKSNHVLVSARKQNGRAKIGIKSFTPSAKGNKDILCSTQLIGVTVAANICSYLTSLLTRSTQRRDETMLQEHSP